MKVIKVIDAVGTTLCHDITKIVPGEFKGVAFKKGHIITEEDIPALLSLGKEHLYVWEDEEGILHENDAALRLTTLTAGSGLYFDEPKEGKITFYASISGLLKVNKEALLELNSIGDIILSTQQNNTVVKKGEKVAATRIIPLTIEDEKLKLAESKLKDKIVNVIPIQKKKVAIVTTGNEVFKGRIKDASYKIIEEKLSEYECQIIGQSILPDDIHLIENTIKEYLQNGAEMVICTGGMSVDPDDVTPKAIKNASSDFIVHGSPVLPGAMFVLSYYNEIPILGLPAGFIFSKRTVFDLVLPRILADERLSALDIASYGHGGFCMNCEECTFPKCGFGKGV